MNKNLLGNTLGKCVFPVKGIDTFSAAKPLPFFLPWMNLIKYQETGQPSWWKADQKNNQHVPYLWEDFLRKKEHPCLFKSLQAHFLLHAAELTPQWGPRWWQGLLVHLPSCLGISLRVRALLFLLSFLIKSEPISSLFLKLIPYLILIFILILRINFPMISKSFPFLGWPSDFREFRFHLLIINVY